LPLYHLYEMNHAVLHPARAVADATLLMFRNPLNPWSQTPLGRSVSAGCELFERSTRRYGKPEFDIGSVLVEGESVAVSEEVIWSRPFCKLRHFSRDLEDDHPGNRTRVLIVAPLSGHYASLLRGTVETMLQRHDVYITDWADARTVPLTQGGFDLDDYIDYLIEIFALFKGDVHVMAVCQPSVPVLASISILEADGNPSVPQSMTLMGGPVDTRINPTAVNKLAEQRGTDWFAENAIMYVPWPNPGVMRKVYPGFLQLTGFMSMNLDRHLDAHNELFQHLVKGDGDSADRHREFYDEYLAVMDLDAAYYLQTVDTVFVKHALPKGKMEYRGDLVEPEKIRSVALMTVEGENDDISGVGQTEAAHTLCTNIPDDRRVHYLQPGAGHYGVFNGSRFRSEIAPRISDFIVRNQRNKTVRRALRLVSR